MIFRTLERHELEAWYDLTGTVFEQTGREYFVRHIRQDPWPVLNSVFVAVDGEKLVSTVRLFHRQLYIGGKVFKMAGIGEVSTLPAYQKQGLSSTLLQMAIDYMEKEGFEVSVLFTGVNGHYAKQGYMDVPLKQARLTAPKARESIRVREATQADMPMMQGVYDLFAPGFDGAVYRGSTAYWQRWVRAEMRSPVYVAQTEAGIQGYLAYTVNKREGQIEVADFAQLPSADVFETLLAHACKASGQDKAFYSHSLNPDQPAEITEDRSMMVRLIRPIELEGSIEHTQDLVQAFQRPIHMTVDAF